MSENRHPKRTKPEVVRARARRGPGKRLTLADRYYLLETHRLHPDWSHGKLAEYCGVNIETARLAVIAAGKNAADLMAAYAAPVLKDWIRASKIAGTKGDHRPARDWLLHAGSIEPLPDTSRGNGPAVVIINSPLPGMPGSTVLVGEVPRTAERAIDGENLAEPVNLAEPEPAPAGNEPDRGE